MQEEIKDWAYRWTMCVKEKSDLLERVMEATKRCNTYGQLFRLWPGLEGFFPAHGREKISSARAKSRLPDNVICADNLQSPALERFSCMIAECLMLPICADKEIATVD
jgi:hypothetical protein